MSLSRILIADVPEAVATWRPFLARHFAVVEAATLDDALHALHVSVDLIVCGVHFDEGRMYDLLRHVKGTPRLAHLPFVAVRCIEGELEFAGALYESVKIAVRTLGGSAFVDLLRCERQYGQQEAGRLFNERLQQLAQDPCPDTL